MSPGFELISTDGIEVIEIPITRDRARHRRPRLLVRECRRPNAVLTILAGAFPDREVVGVPSRLLAYGGGGIHCTTRQIPTAPAKGAP